MLNYLLKNINININKYKLFINYFLHYKYLYYGYNKKSITVKYKHYYIL